LILLGHLLGDGCILPHQSCHYTNKDMLNIMSVKNAAYQLFGITGKIIKQNDYYHIYLPHPKWIAHKDEHSIAIWYKKLGINMVRSYDKVIPNGVFECDSDKIALFLRHLWSTDGNLSWKFFKKRTPTCAIYYSSTSKKLATQVQELLLRLEIFSTITVSPKEGYRDSYLVQIFGCRNQLKFINNIGINDTRNNEVPEMKKSLLSIKENLNNDIFPKDIWNIIREEKSKCDLSWREISKRINTSFCGFALFKSGVSRNRLEKIAEVLDSEKLHEIANSDILWDKVNFITKLGVEKTYDITTKEHHNFIANDIIVHNSIEQDVTSVLFIYRDEVYGIELDRKGRSTKNIAEFIVKKNRFGESPKTKRIKFNASFTRFEDIPEDNGFFFKR
jgi:replicative DNA helicase